MAFGNLSDDPKIKTKILAELEKRGNNLGIIGSKSGEIVTGKSTPMYKLQNEKTGELAKAPNGIEVINFLSIVKVNMEKK